MTLKYVKINTKLPKAIAHVYFITLVNWQPRWKRRKKKFSINTFCVCPISWECFKILHAKWVFQSSQDSTLRRKKSLINYHSICLSGRIQLFLLYKRRCVFMIIICTNHNMKLVFKIVNLCVMFCNTHQYYNLRLRIWILFNIRSIIYCITS